MSTDDDEPTWEELDKTALSSADLAELMAHFRSEANKEQVMSAPTLSEPMQQFVNGRAQSVYRVIDMAIYGLRDDHKLAVLRLIQQHTDLIVEHLASSGTAPMETAGGDL
jgi:hypothetical protein